ncbi:hypothetical protein LK12_17580 [Novosphingobium malaysiense]|uniref:HTH tetR-type domain-containing protein n=1 Tax=Novosphingobium malaysiense TaxID=1348853 RepID=A0A0B1ZMI6_9SPHN|nr:hypothetical protein LK12_17580 [Novosphingobium malaysiense]
MAAGLEKLLTKSPYEAITLADIAAEAGIARNTVYNYAKDKPALVAALTAAQAQILYDEVVAICGTSENPGPQLARALHAIVTWFGNAEHRHLILCALFGPALKSATLTASAPLLRISSAVEAVILRGIETGHFRPIRDVRLTVDMMGKAAEAAAFHVVKNPETLETTSSELRAFILHALGYRGAA